MAKLLDTNVVLVIDSNGITRGVAPLLMGYQTFDTNVNIVGVILNKVAGERHESKLVQAIEYYTDTPVLGAVRRSKELVIDERHLGLMPANESTQSQRFINIATE
jgi:cobyrinic acid a,c-diamide synthase